MATTMSSVNIAFPITMIGWRARRERSSSLPGWAHAETSDPKLAAWLRGVRAEALKSGVDAGTLDAALGSVEEIPRVMELARNQPEFKMTWDQYRELVVSNERVTKGRALLKENRALVDRFYDLMDLEPGYARLMGDGPAQPASPGRAEAVAR